MLRSSALLMAALCVRAAVADCPPDCVGGGHVPATDCFVEFGGIASTNETCTDGSPSCDMDGTVNGVCTFALSVCLNVTGGASCTPGGLTAPPVVRPLHSPVAQALAQSLAMLDPAASACTPPGVAVPLATSLVGVRPGVARLAITATSGGKRDRNKLKLTCRPSPESPSFADTIRPIFASHCALPACHTDGPSVIAPVLDGAEAYPDIVSTPATNVPRLMLVHPGSVAESYLARKILGKRIPDRTERMPQGCPENVPSGGCLTDGEIAAILAWIQTGAPNN
jgi:hypothetical protein